MKAKLVLIIILCAGFRLSAQNNAPQFTSEPVTEVYEFQLYSYQITATDADGDSIIFLETDVPEWLSIIDFLTKRDTAYLIGKPNEFFDTAYVNIGITDGTDTTCQVFNIVLFCSSCGIPIYTQPIDTAYVDINYEYIIYAGSCDPVTEILFECDTLPAWLNFENTGLNTAVLSGIPSAGDKGTYEIIIRAYFLNDPCFNDTYQIFDLKVVDKLSSVDNNNPDNFRVYPVPCKDRLIIDPGGISYKNHVIRIYSAEGHNLLLIRNTEQYQEIDISCLSGGIYMLEVTDENYDVVCLRTFIKL